MYKGQFKFDIQGSERGFKFGTLAVALFCKQEGITPKDFQQRINDGDPFIDIDYAYYAAVAYCQINKKDVDFTKEEVSCWIDEVGSSRFAEMIVESFKTFVPKNVIPPKEGEQMNGAGKTSPLLESENVG